MIINALTFELRIFLRKKRSRIEQLKKGVKRRLFFCVPAQEAKSGQPLAPILGQVQINTFDFCTIFNTKSKDFPKGLKLFVELVVKWDKTFEVLICPFPLSLVVYEFLYGTIREFVLPLKKRHYIGVSDLFKLAVLYSHVSGVANLKHCVRSVLGCLFSYDVCVLPCSESEFLESLQHMLVYHPDTFLMLEKSVKGFGVLDFHLQTSQALLSTCFDSDFGSEELTGAESGTGALEKRLTAEHA